MNRLDEKLLAEIADLHKIPEGSYNIRKDGKCLSRNSTSDIEILPKKDKDGIDIIVKSGVKNKSCHIPVILTKAGLMDSVYNDFYIKDDCTVTIIAGCGISCSGSEKSQHDGIHTFHIGSNCNVKYVEKHIGFGDVKAQKVLNPTTKIIIGKNSIFEMQTSQIGGVTYSDRKTYATIGENSKLLITEKILTTENQTAKTLFKVNLKGKNSSTDVSSRSVAKDNSNQQFISNIIGNNISYGHISCDGIVTGNAKMTSVPKIIVNDANASLQHEAVIGKIAGEQLTKLMSLGLNAQEAEDIIIKGYLN